MWLTDRDLDISGNPVQKFFKIVLLFFVIILFNVIQTPINIYNNFRKKRKYNKIVKHFKKRDKAVKRKE